MIDVKGETVSVGDTVRVLKLPNVKLSDSEMKEVQTMLEEQFVIESIENECAEVTKWFGSSGEETWCHSLFLFPDEFELVKKAE